LSLTFESRPFEVKRVIVFSRSQSRKDGRAEFISSDVAGFVRRFKRTKGGNIWLVGGADIVQPCMKSDLIDEYVISVHPVVLGGGIPLFRAPFPRTKLKLTRFKAFKSGLVQLTYKR
jgi:dihydrofolate reductase